MRLSLCVIAGNVERQMPRFLDAFKGLADEVIVVSALGDQRHDKTISICKDAGCRHAIYFNGDSGAFSAEASGCDHPDVCKCSRFWPHVDDFAAARNMACDMATGDWLMWADTDDVITADSIAQIKALLPQIPDEVDGVLMRYVIPEDGVINWRERIWRRGSARWENPIHECLRFKDGANHMRFEGAEIVHASEKRSASRDERNLRILESIPEDKRTISQHFHVFQSLIALDRDAEAIPKAIQFLGMEGVGKNERYEALFQLARLAAEPEQKHAMLLQAVATDPTRREAFGELGLACVPHDAPAALGWTTAMGALSIPQEAPWNLRRSYYGQLGVHLHGMALRVNNRQEEADTMERNHFIRAGAKISLLHATRGRPAKAWRCRMDWLRAASNPDAIEHIFGIDADDASSFMLTATRHVVSWPNDGPVGAWNAAARASSGAILVQLSDDWEPFPGWDLAILEAIGDPSAPAVLAVSDGHRKDDLLCMAILTRARYKQQGYLFHPEFFSMFSDNWFSRQAFADGVVIDARDRITFEHVHPAFGKAEMDATYARSNDGYHYKTGEGMFRRLCEGVKVSAAIQGWFDFRDFYDYVAKVLPDDGKFVEVGAWKGKSAVYLADRLKDLGKSFAPDCVDTFKGDADTGQSDVLAEFMENTQSRGIGYTVGNSTKSADWHPDKSLDGILIDAAHDYESVKADITAWLPKLKPGGIFAGHDIDSPEVQRALADCGIEYETMGRVWIKKP